MSNKRNRVLKNESRRSPVTLIVTIAVVVTALGSFILFDQGVLNFGSSKTGSSEVAAAKDGFVTLPAADFGDGQARYYSYEFQEASVRFFVMRSSDGVIRAAFDACDVCFREKKGYSQDGDVMVCNNCGQRFPSTLINVEQGGCNPAPLRRMESGGTVTLAVSDIFAGLRFFDI